jgi:hypothetical protein
VRRSEALAALLRDEAELGRQRAAASEKARQFGGFSRADMTAAGGGGPRDGERGIGGAAPGPAGGPAGGITTSYVYR